MNKNQIRGYIPFLFVILYLVLTFILLYTTPILKAVESLDHDKPYYTEQLQKVILGEKTGLMYPELRLFSPALSILISQLMQLSYAQSMLILTLIAGVISIFVYYNYSRTRTEKMMLPFIFIFSPVIMVYSVTYFIEIMTFLFIIAIYYILKDIFVNKNGSAKNWILLNFFIIIGILNKELILLYLIVMLVFFFVFYNSKRTMKWYALLVMTLCMALIAYYLNYFYLYDALKNNILNFPGQSNVILHRAGLFLKNIFYSGELNLFNIVRSVFSGYAFFWVFIGFGVYLGNKKLRLQVLYIGLSGLILFITMFPSPKYFFTMTFPFFFYLIYEGFIKMKKRYGIGYFYLILAGMLNIVAILLYSVMLLGK